MTSLRPYQRAAVDSVFDYFKFNSGNPLVVCPTGSGKSIIQAFICKDAIERYRETRILIISHSKEVLEQNAAKIFQIWPGCPVGIYSAGLGSRRFGKITVAGIQSVCKRGDDMPLPDLVIVDEAHRVPRKGAGQYLTLFKKLRARNPNCKFIGLTATAFRLDSGVLTDGLDPLFTDICYNISLVELIQKGYLAPLISKNAVTQANLSSVKVSAGEYVQKDLSRVMNDRELTEAAVSEMLQFARNRKSWIIFGVDVAHVQLITRTLEARGISCAAITGETLPMLRAQSIAKFKRLEIQVLVSCEVLTTGFDAPNVDCIGILRATKSTGLYVQILGRGMRTYPGKKNCLVLDFGGNIERHGPIDCIHIGSKDARTGKTEVTSAPQKTCPKCRTSIHAAARQCSECGFEFPESESQAHAPTASEKNLIAALAPPQEFKVLDVVYSLHSKPGKVPSMRASYDINGVGYCVSEWICFEHEGRARSSAVAWWVNAGGNFPPPSSVAEALERENELRKPVRIWVKEEGRFDRIVSVNYETEERVALELSMLDEAMNEGFI